MDDRMSLIEPHRTEEAYARRRKLGADFDRAAVTPGEALEHALVMVEELKRDSRWQPAPVK